MYKSIIRPILFLFQPETIHYIIFLKLKLAAKIPGIPAIFRALFQLKHKSLEREVFGIMFPNPVGLAAGLDKDAELPDMFGNMGFGFVEIGTVTPIAQSGNERPRLFRLINDKALINRMGFNNRGADFMLSKLKQRQSNVIVGGNIGKNKITPNSKALDDYITCMNILYHHVDYFVVNVSSPNTPNLRELQEKEPLRIILAGLKNEAGKYEKSKPVLLKIAPDLSNSQLDDIIEIVGETGIDGIVATNTTILRDGLSYSKEHIESLGTGGLSGKPLRERSTEIIRYISNKSEGKIPIIGVGGIFTAEDAVEKLNAGASLVQVYTGFIYEGPGIAKNINKLIL
ncbi:MAG: quinone-dependent dihydroorotate dehydrogenase [Bacteroidota bacterium]|nr:quinone-dependent dihydroorotate dehydrogenase [Bacteroidota bacterium]